MFKKTTTRVLAFTSVAAALCLGAHSAQALEIDLPGETALYKESSLPGYSRTA